MIRRDDPEIASASGPAARRFLIAKIRRPLEPVANTNGLSWEDVLPALECVDTIAELKAAVTAPEAFLETAASSLGPVAFKLALAKLRPKMEPFIQRHDVTWEDVLPVFMMLTGSCCDAPCK